MIMFQPVASCLSLLIFFLLSLTILFSSCHTVSRSCRKVWGSMWGIMTVLTDAKARAIKPGTRISGRNREGLWPKPTEKKGRGQWIFRYVSPITKKRQGHGIRAIPMLPSPEPET